MQIKKTDPLFNLLKADITSPSAPKLLGPYIDKFLTFHPYTGGYFVEDSKYVSSVTDIEKKHFHPSGDCLKCAKLLYWERDPEHVADLEEAIMPGLQVIFKTGNALHAMIQAWIKAMGELEGYPKFIANEQRIVDEQWNIGGYIDSVIQFPGENFDTLIELKGLALDTLIPTIDGFSTMGDLNVGDIVFDKDGKQCKVITKSEIHNKPCMKIYFDDKTSVICDEDHRWLVSKYQYRSDFIVMTTKEMYEIGADCCNGSRFAVPISGFLDIEEKKDIGIDPYVLGLWLADGFKYAGSITESYDSPIWEEIEKRGYVLGKLQRDKRNKSCTRTILGIHGWLKSNNLLENKHIPKDAFRWGTNQRIELLRGILDGDGTYSKTRNQVVFSSTKKEYIEEVRELIHTLGIKTTVCDYDTTGFGKDIHTYSVRFIPKWFNPFCARNKDIPVDKVGEKSKVRYIRKIEIIDSVPTQCIEVDSPSHTYLFGDQCCVTHNTISDYGFKLLKEPHVAHKMQVATYLMIRDLPRGIVYYINKNTGERKEFEVNQIDMMPVLSKWSDVMHAVAKHDPSGLVGLCKEGDKTWEKCPARSFCKRCSKQ